MKETSQNKIEQAAQSAIKVLADAANEATRAIATAAGEATKLVNITSSADHDLLIKLETKMDGLKEDIRLLSDGTAKQINDHEIRLNALETEKTRTTVMLSIGVGILGLLVSLLVWHLVGK